MCNDYGNRIPYDEYRPRPKLHMVAVHCLLGLFNSRLIVRALDDLCRSRDVTIWLQRIGV